MFAQAISPERDGKFSYGFEFGGEGMCGVTPELLFSVKDGVLKTMALAGTGAGRRVRRCSKIKRKCTNTVW